MWPKKPMKTKIKHKKYLTSTSCLDKNNVNVNIEPNVKVKYETRSLCKVLKLINVNIIYEDKIKL